MTIAELETLIAAVDAALLDVVTGKAQSVSIAGRTVTKSNITELNNFRKDLERELIDKTGEGRPAVVAFRNPVGGGVGEWETT